jgi:hypothetical protein
MNMHTLPQAKGTPASTGEIQCVEGRADQANQKRLWLGGGLVVCLLLVLGMWVWDRRCLSGWMGASSSLLTQSERRSNPSGRTRVCTRAGCSFGPLSEPADGV